jgi:putative transcriptional regulator
VLHRTAQKWQSSLKVTDDLALTSSRDILQAMGCAEQPADVLVTLGYAGWTAGQLEWELAQNTWLTVEASPHILFNVPSEDRLAAAMQLLGVDFANLSEVAGHA